MLAADARNFARRLLSISLLASLVFSLRPLVAQSSATVSRFKEFDVASIHENRTSEEEVRMNFPLGPGDAYTPSNGLLRVANMPLSGYIVFAYKLSNAQSAALNSQLPQWVNITRYDIEAKVEGQPAKDDMRAMMRALLADRFHLRLRNETRETSVLDMVPARPGRVGPALKLHPPDDPKCLLTPGPDGFFSPCGIFGILPGTPVKAAGRNIPLQMFADNLSGFAGKPVIDRTGISGNFDFTLVFVPDSQQSQESQPAPSAPNFLEALSEQAGFKLLPGKAPALFYLFDHIERPSSN